MLYPGNAVSKLLYFGLNTHDFSACQQTGACIADESLELHGGGVRGEVDVMGPPMLITYRLQGLDGEATERIIEHLVEPAAEQQEPEQEYSVARLLADQGPSGGALPCYVLPCALPLPLPGPCLALPLTQAPAPLLYPLQTQH